MAFYESVIIARQDVSTAQVDALTEKYVGILTSMGGEIGRKEYWGVRSLAYRIKKNRKGHYLLINYDAPAAAKDEMERNLGLDEDILRVMTVRVEAMPTEASAVLTRRDDRPERGDRGDRPDRGPRGDRGDRGDRGGDRGDRGGDRGGRFPSGRAERGPRDFEQGGDE